MQIFIYGMAMIAPLLILSLGWKPLAPPSVTPKLEMAQAPTKATTIISVSLPVNAKVWLKGGGFTTGQVTGFNAKQQVLTLGKESIPLTKIGKVIFDRKALVYQSDGKLVFRGADTAKAELMAWENVALDAFELKDPKLGQAQVNLAGVVTPPQLKGIRSVAVKSVYVVDEIQFPSAGKMTITVIPGDRPSRR